MICCMEIMHVTFRPALCIPTGGSLSTNTGAFMHLYHPLTTKTKRSALAGRPVWIKLAMRFGLMLLVIAAITACYGPPPTAYVIITDTPTGQETLTPTPTPIVTVIVVTATPQPGTPVVEVPPIQTTEDVLPDNGGVLSTAEVTSGEITDPSSLIPTATFNRVYIAEQTFENGRMFWIEPITQIWVMVQNTDDKRSGIWMVFDDPFQEGDQEFDPGIRPPAGLLQPERGFGLLWRENDEVRGALGWATQTEIGHVSDYQFQPSGTMENGEFVPEPGYHILNSGYGSKTFRFNEINGTWQTLRDDTPTPTGG